LDKELNDIYAELLRVYLTSVDELKPTLKKYFEKAEIDQLEFIKVNYLGSDTLKSMSELMNKYKDRTNQIKQG